MKYARPDKSQWAEDDPRQQINAFDDEQFRAIYNDWMPPEQPPLESLLGLNKVEQWIASKIPERGIALDIGCGNGKLLIELYLGNYILSGFGIDISDQMVKNARLSTINLNCSAGFAFARMALEDAKFINKYDIVIMSEVLEHFFNVHLAIQNVCNIMGKNGIFLGNLPLEHTCDAVVHLHYFSLESLIELMYTYFEHVEATIIDVTGEGEDHIAFACRKPRRTDEST